MTPKKIILWAAIAALLLILIAIFVFENPDLNHAVSALAPEQTKTQLQEQLGEELRQFYLGEDNWQECKRLIDTIEKMDH